MLLLISIVILFIVDKNTYIPIIIVIGLLITSLIDKSINIFKVECIRSLLDERAKHEYLLVQSENRFKSLFFKLNISIAILDTENLKFLDCNEFFCNQIGYSNYELKNMSIGEILIKEDYDYILKVNNHRISQGITIDEYKLKYNIIDDAIRTYYKKDGNLLKIRWSFTSGDRKDIAFLVGYLVD